MNEPVMQIADDQPGFSRHGGMHSVAREKITQDRVLGVGRAAADKVARVEIPHDQGNFGGLKVRLNLLAQERSDVLEPDVAGGVAGTDSESSESYTETGARFDLRASQFKVLDERPIEERFILRGVNFETASASITPSAPSP